MLTRTKLLLSSFVLAGSGFAFAPAMTQAQTVEPECYPVTSCDDNDPEIADAVYTLTNEDLVRLAEREGLGTGSLFIDALLGIGVSYLNPYVGGTAALTIAAINDGIGDSAELADYALSSGKDVIITVKENPSGYPAVEILNVYLD